MSLLNLFMFAMFFGVIAAHQVNEEMIDNQLDVESTAMDATGKIRHTGMIADDVDAQMWSTQCTGGFMFMDAIYKTTDGVIYLMTCNNKTGVVTDVMETVKTNSTDGFSCPANHILVGILSSMDGKMKVSAVRCANSELAVSADNCSTVEYSFNKALCNATQDEYMVGFTLDAQVTPSTIKCCKAGPTEQAGNQSELDKGVTRIQMTTCLEVDPFYTECGASCWSGHLSSSLTIKAIQINGSSIQEIHCQENNVTLSLIQVNKFVLQLYPFLVCPPNHLVTAIWSNSHADLHLKTIKCNMLHPGQQMTDCQMFDTESDVAGCDSDDGYYMAGMMLDQDDSVTQVMCCHVDKI